MPDYSSIKIRPAKFKEHDKILAIAKQSKYTRDFGNHMFSGEEMYAKGWIRVAVLGRKIVGFYCCRHKVREPQTKLYFLTVDKDHLRHGIACELMLDLEEQTPHCWIALDCCKDNDACQFYEWMGYERTGDALDGKAYRFEKSWE